MVDYERPSHLETLPILRIKKGKLQCQFKKKKSVRDTESTWNSVKPLWSSTSGAIWWPEEIGGWIETDWIVPLWPFCNLFTHSQMPNVPRVFFTVTLQQQPQVKFMQQNILTGHNWTNGNSKLLAFISCEHPVLIKLMWYVCLGLIVAGMFNADESSLEEHNKF